MTKEEILDNMLSICKENDFEPTKNIEKIANAKYLMFKEDWKRCPCDSQNRSRFCISEQCKSDIETNGECHCHCYRRKNDNERNDG